MTRQKNGIWKLTDSEMNYIALLAGEAEERYEQIGLNALLKEAREIHAEIHNILVKAGYYDSVK